MTRLQPNVEPQQLPGLQIRMLQTAHQHSCAVLTQTLPWQMSSLIDFMMKVNNWFHYMAKDYKMGTHAIQLHHQQLCCVLQQWVISTGMGTVIFHRQPCTLIAYEVNYWKQPEKLSELHHKLQRYWPENIIPRVTLRENITSDEVRGLH